VTRITSWWVVMGDDSLIAWLQRKGDWLIALLLVAVLTSTAIGLKDRATGGAIFVSNLTAALCALAAYPFIEKWGYGGPAVFALGLVCGAIGLAAFGVLTALRDRITRRRDSIADNLIDRVAPGTQGKNDD